MLHPGMRVSARISFGESAFVPVQAAEYTFTNGQV